MSTQANEAPYLSILIGGVVAILLGTSGIAAVMAWTPTSTDVAGVVFAPDELATPPARPVGAQVRLPPALAENDARVSVKCAECGVVASTREIEQPGAGIDPGAAGEVTRGGRYEIPGKSTKRFEVTVRMNDGSSRVFLDPNPADWPLGERVILVEGASHSNK